MVITRFLSGRKTQLSVVTPQSVLTDRIFLDSSNLNPSTCRYGAPEPAYNEPEPAYGAPEEPAAYGAPESTEYSAPAYSAPGDVLELSNLVVPVLVIVGKKTSDSIINTCKLFAEYEAKLSYRKPIFPLLS